MSIRPKALITSLFLILALAFSASESAYASQPLQPHAGPAIISAPAKADAGKSGKAAKPNEVDYCIAANTEPFFVTYHGKLYGQSDVKCPAPFTECRVQVDMDKAGPYGSYTVASSDSGWGACPSPSGKIYTVGYTCAGWSAGSFTVIVSISGLADGVTTSDVGAGKTATVDCV